MVLVIVGSDANKASETAKGLSRFGQVEIATSNEDLQRILQDHQKVDLFFVSVPEVGPEYVGMLCKHFRVPVFLLGELPPAELRKAYEIGVQDIFPYPLNPLWVEERLSRMGVRPRPASPWDTKGFPAVPRETEEMETRSSGVFTTERTNGLANGEANGAFPVFGQAPVLSQAPNVFSPQTAPGIAQTAPVLGPEWGGELMPEIRPRTTNKIIGIASVKGGEGKTSLTGQLGMLLARSGYTTLGIDADQTGNLARWIGRGTPGDILAFDTDRYPRDRSELESLLAKHAKTDFRVLSSSLRALKPITPVMVERALQAYRPMFPIILVDLGEGYTPVLKRVAGYATDLIVVTTTDVSRMERTRQLIQTLLAEGIPAKKLHVVVNKVRDEEDYLPIRAWVSEYKINLWTLPWNSELAAARKEGLCPVITDAKSAYAKAFRTFVKEALRITPSGTGGADMAETKKSDPKKKKRKKKKSAFSFGGLFRRFGTANEE